MNEPLTHSRIEKIQTGIVASSSSNHQLHQSIDPKAKYLCLTPYFYRWIVDGDIVPTVSPRLYIMNSALFFVAAISALLSDTLGGVYGYQQTTAANQPNNNGLSASFSRRNVLATVTSAAISALVVAPRQVLAVENDNDDVLTPLYFGVGVSTTRTLFSLKRIFLRPPHHHRLTGLVLSFKYSSVSGTFNTSSLMESEEFSDAMIIN